MKTIYIASGHCISREKWIARLRELQMCNNDDFITNVYYNEDEGRLEMEMFNDWLPSDAD